MYRRLETGFFKVQSTWIAISPTFQSGAGILVPEVNSAIGTWKGKSDMSMSMTTHKPQVEKVP